jgi:hypothetical protein
MNTENSASTRDTATPEQATEYAVRTCDLHEPTQQCRVHECETVVLASEHRAVVDELTRLRKELALAFDVLALYGVPQERARTVHNGIHVLEQRMSRELADAKGAGQWRTMERLTDAQCDAALEALVLLDWIGFTRENMRELDSVLQEVRALSPAPQGGEDG